MIKNFCDLLSFNFPRKPNPDKPELTIEYSIGNIQLLFVTHKTAALEGLNTVLVDILFHMTL